MSLSLLRTAWLVCLFTVSASLAHGEPAGPRLPRDLRFEANIGQTQGEVAFVARGRAHTIYLTSAETVFSSPGTAVRMRLIGADAHARLTGRGLQPGATNYLIGDSRHWVRDVHSYSRVVREQAYPGIDVVYRGDDGALAYDFVVAPDAKPSTIRFRFEGVSGLRISAAGDLVLTTATGDVTHRRPVAYQGCGGIHRDVPARFRVSRSRVVTFAVGKYDPRCSLTIDPTVLRASYFGGNGPASQTELPGADEVNAIALDSSGNAYVAGASTSTAFTFPGAPEPVGSGSLLVSKIDAAGDVAYITLIGADSLNEYANGTAIAVDDVGAAYVAGLTDDGSFPVTPGTVSTSLPGFVLKLDHTGANIAYALLIPVVIRGLAVDANRQAVFAGEHGPFVGPPIVNALQPGRAGETDGYLAKLNEDATAFVFATYLGGSRHDQLNHVALDANGDIYVAGSTFSPDFPVANGLQPDFGGGEDCVVAKLPSDGSALIYSTFFGGTHGDQCVAVAVDRDERVTVVGVTGSDDFPVRFPFQRSRSPGASPDAFVARLEPDGLSLRYSTYLGGAFWDVGQSVAIGPDGDAYVTGVTASADFPTVRPTQAHNAGPIGEFPGSDAFVTRFDPLGRVVYSTFFGGSDFEYGWGIAVDSLGRAHAVGTTRSPDLPIVNSLKPELEGYDDAFLLTLVDDACPADISNRVVPVPLPALPFAGGVLRLQFMFLVNVSAAPIATPVSATFDGLTPGIFLLSPGFTFCPATSGAQFASVGAPGSAIAPGAAILTAVVFYSPDPALVLTYSSRVLAGRPHR